MTNAAINTTLASLSDGTTYIVRVRAVSTMGIRSEWSDTFVLPVNGSSTTGGGTNPPSGFVVSAGLRKIIAQWDRPSVTVRYWELFITNQNDPTLQLPEYPLDGSLHPVDPTANFYGTSADTIETLDKYFDDLGTDGGGWHDLVADTLYYVAIRAVGTNNIRSDPVWAAATTGLIANSDFQAGTITADKIVTSELFADLEVVGSLKSTVATDGSYVIFDAAGIRAIAQGSTTSFNLSAVNGSAVFSGVIDVGLSAGDHVVISRVSDGVHDYGEISFNAGTGTASQRAHIYENHDAPSGLDIMKIGSSTDALDRMDIGLNFGGANGSYFSLRHDDSYHFQFNDHGQTLVKFAYTAGGTDFQFPYGLPILSGTTVVYTSGHQLGLLTSSKRFKKDIVPLAKEVNAPVLLSKLKPVRFTYTNETEGRREIGFVAEEVYKHEPNLVNLDEEGLPFSLAFQNFLPLLVAGYQDLYKKVKLLEGKVKSLDSKV